MASWPERDRPAWEAGTCRADLFDERNAGADWSLSSRQKTAPMMRAAIYARFSSENQSASSIADQIEVCSRYIAKNGWTAVRTYSDAAMSGASRFRPGYQQLLADLDYGLFDLVVVEALDRLGRKLADIADLHDRCTFAGIILLAVNVGEITAMHIGMLGTMAQLYLSDLKQKTWRGQLGRALQGKIPGGKAYGYDLVTAAAGERQINPVEAAMVCRIFTEFANGHSPRAIAKRLNAEAVPGPNGRPWGDTTIRGQAERGTGLLNNALYVGRLERNRCSYVKDPRTGKRVARPNPREKWEITAVPQLRIIDDELWQRVKARQETLRFAIGRDTEGNALNRAHRRHFLLSGLLVCGSCGGGYTIVGPDRYGCAAHRSKGTCTNALLIGRHTLEDRVLCGLKERMMEPDLVADFVDAFNAEMRKLATSAEYETLAAKRTLAEIERKLAAIVRAIEDGAYTDTLKARLTKLEQEKAQTEARLCAGKCAPVLRLHTNLPELYRSKIGHLTEALNAPQTVTEAAEIMRGLIDRIVLTPGDGELRAELHGDLAVLARFAQERECRFGGNPPGLSVVAGARNHLNLLFNAPRLELPLWWRGLTAAYANLKRAYGAGSRRALVLFEGDDHAARNRTQVSCTARGLEADDRGRALPAGLSLIRQGAGGPRPDRRGAGLSDHQGPDARHHSAGV
jgi:site-specific DNA recombinase